MPANRPSQSPGGTGVPPVLFLILLTLTLLAPTVAAQSDQQLIERYDRLYAAEKYELALQAAETICQRHPAAAQWHFNAGALSARLGHYDRAIEYLRTCADNNYSGIESFRHNTNLDPIRDREDFKTILRTVEDTAKARMEAFQAEAKNHKPEAYHPPPSAEKPPLIIALHGTGMDGRSMLDALQPAAEEQLAILICPDALRPAGDGFSWTYRDESRWFVNHLIDDAIANHNADPDRVILIGFSQGANIALILGRTHPDRFLAVVPICGHYEPQLAAATATPAPHYLISGARDPWRKTYSRARQDLEAAGGMVQTRILTARGHELPTGPAGTREYTRAIKWALEQVKGD